MPSGGQWEIVGTGVIWDDRASSSRTPRPVGPVMIGWTALILAVAALVNSTRLRRNLAAARKLDRMANRLKPIDLATPEQFGVVTKRRTIRRPGTGAAQRHLR